MILAVDTETTGSDFWHGCKPFMITACDGEFNYCWTGEVNPYNRAEVIWDNNDLDEVQQLIDSADKLLMHNAKFDVRALEVIGIDAKWWEKLEDTMIATHVCCSGDKMALKYNAFKYLGYFNEEERLLKNAVLLARQQNTDYDLARQDHPCFPGEGGPGTSWYKMDYWLCINECRKYGIDDVEMTWLLWKLYEEVMEHHELIEQYEVRKQLLPITYRMEEVGMHLYADQAQQQIRIESAIQENLREQIQSESQIGHHVDLTKEQHISFFLFDALGLKPTEVSDKTGKPLTNKDVIQKYIDQNPDIAPLQHFSDYRKSGTKIGYLNQYLKYIDDNNRIHSNVLITGTRETRQASRNPNMQNIDKSMKHLFGPPPGKDWLIYDLVNIELRVWGYSVGNPEMVEIFDANKSFHMEIVKSLYAELNQECLERGITFKKEYGETLYTWVKNGNFSVIYGAGPKKADRTYQLPGAYYKIIRRFPEVPSFTAARIAEVENNNLVEGVPYIECLGGYRLEVNIHQLHTKACNYYSQGSAGYIIGLCMIEVVKEPIYLETGAEIINQVHDSLYIEVDSDKNTPKLQQGIKRAMERGGEQLLPTCEAELETILYGQKQ